ncbi:hypothetical protein D2L64_06035 [Micromonospora radicis]|uniref:Uncharacterized protein n=1 Tax=Micromonospora radicis TaxID=1894971 RepID=A0A418MY05_9ACTN|nr:hypothetical protein D2L64_06035 [Micromonospora radicis]
MATTPAPPATATPTPHVRPTRPARAAAVRHRPGAADRSSIPGPGTRRRRWRATPPSRRPRPTPGSRARTQQRWRRGSESHAERDAYRTCLSSAGNPASLTIKSDSGKHPANHQDS